VGVHVRTKNGRLAVKVSMDSCRPDQVLCRVVDRVQLQFFDVHSESWTSPIPLSAAIEVRNSAFLLLSTQSLVCVGGYDSKYQSFLRTALLIASAGTISELPCLTVARCGIGLVEHEGRVWGFGGRDVRVGPVVERLRLVGEDWEVAREMSTARAYFSPVVYEEEAYLCGGLTLSCECFSFLTETYRPLSYDLPESSESLTVLLPTGFVILTGRYITRLPYKQGESTQQEARIDCVKSSCGPLAFGAALFVISEGEAWKVDLDSCRVALLR